MEVSKEFSYGELKGTKGSQVQLEARACLGSWEGRGLRVQFGTWKGIKAATERERERDSWSSARVGVSCEM